MQPGFAPLFEWLSVHVKFNLVVGAADTMINSVSGAICIWLTYAARTLQRDAPGRV